MRVITFDIGNSNPHFGVFENQKFIGVYPLSSYSDTASDVKILCSVKKENSLKVDFNLNEFKKNKTFFDMPFDYADTLGIDRLVAAYLPYCELNSSETVMIIDAGTFMTVDLVNKNFGFNGGWIFPGIKTFLNSYGNGDLLPTLEYKKSSSIIPKNTNDAIMEATNTYLRSVLNEVVRSASPSKIYITGGSGKIIFDILKEFNLKTELQIEQNLLHFSMYLIHLHHLK